MLRSLVNLNPIADLQQVADMMDRAFGNLRPVQSESENNVRHGWSLPVDIFEKDNKLVIKAAVPGIRPDDLNVTIEDNVLTISGEIEDENESNDKVYRREYRYGSFSRSLRLPENIDTQGVEAEFDHGFVKVTLPRVIPQKEKALKVPVKAVSELPSREGKKAEKAQTLEQNASSGAQSKN